MSKIDISDWKEFNLSDLFEIQLSNDDLQQKKLSEGNFPLVSSGKTNNGIVMYIEKQEKAKMFNGNTLTVDMFGKCFLQDKEYYCVSHGRVNVLKPKFKMNRNIGLYLSCIIENSFASKFSFSVMCSSSLLKKEKIKLPVAVDGNPNWDYMDRYMQKTESVAKMSLGLLRCVNSDNSKCNISNWKEFEVEELFEIISPKVYHTREVKEDIDGIPYVVRSKFNNGIKYYVKKEEKFVLNPSNVISFGAENASFFYQEKEYISGRDMYYLDTRSISKNASLFIIACLETITNKYSYNFGLFPKLLKKEKIKLPVTIDGKPDWDYMDKYMDKVDNSIRSKLMCFKRI